jgi:hypothetical protein
MSLEEIYNQFCEAHKKKVWIDDINNKSLNFNPDTDKSLCFFNNNNSSVSINNKCNHIFIYNCNNVRFYIHDCISGITLINCEDCNILLGRIPRYNIEIKTSRVIIRCHAFSFPILFYDSDILLIKQLNFVVQEWMKIITNIFQEWSYNYFNF